MIDYGFFILIAVIVWITAATSDAISDICGRLDKIEKEVKNHNVKIHTD